MSLTPQHSFQQLPQKNAVVIEGKKYFMVDPGSSNHSKAMEMMSQPKVRGPSKIRRVGNFVKAAAKHMATGSERVTSEESQRRFAICSSNRCGVFESKGADHGVCLHNDCGCPVRLKGGHGLPDKLTWKSSVCPVGLW